MAKSLYLNASELAELTSGRLPDWTVTTISADMGAPTSSTTGVAMQDSVRCLWRVRPRENPAFRTAYVKPGVLDAASTYRVTVSGTNCDASGSATLATLLGNIVTAINTGAAATVLATAVDTDDDGVNDSVKITGLAEADWYLSASIVSGTGTWTSKKADASTAAVRIWNLPEGNDADVTSTVWCMIGNFPVSVDRYGWTDEFKSGGFNRVYLQVASLTGHASDSGLTYTATWELGPCIRETLDS